MWDIEVGEWVSTWLADLDGNANVQRKCLLKCRETQHDNTFFTRSDYVFRPAGIRFSDRGTELYDVEVVLCHHAMRVSSYQRV